MELASRSKIRKVVINTDPGCVGCRAFWLNFEPQSHFGAKWAKKYAMLVSVRSEPILGAFCFLHVFLFRLSHLRGGTTSLRIRLPQARFVLLFLPLFALSFPLVFLGVRTLRGTYLPFLFFSPFFSFLPCVFRLFLFFSSINVPGLLACVCCACRFQYGGMALYCILPWQHYDVPIKYSTYVYLS